MPARECPERGGERTAGQRSEPEREHVRRGGSSRRTPNRCQSARPGRGRRRTRLAGAERQLPRQQAAERAVVIERVRVAGQPQRRALCARAAGRHGSLAPRSSAAARAVDAPRRPRPRSISRTTRRRTARTRRAGGAQRLLPERLQLGTLARPLPWSRIERRHRPTRAPPERELEAASRGAPASRSRSASRNAQPGAGLTRRRSRRAGPRARLASSSVEVVEDNRAADAVEPLDLVAHRLERSPKAGLAEVRLELLHVAKLRLLELAQRLAVPEEVLARHAEDAVLAMELVDRERRYRAVRPPELVRGHHDVEVERHDHAEDTLARLVVDPGERLVEDDEPRRAAVARRRVEGRGRGQQRHVDEHRLLAAGADRVPLRGELHALAALHLVEREVEPDAVVERGAQMRGGAAGRVGRPRSSRACWMRSRKKAISGSRSASPSVATERRSRRATVRSSSSSRGAHSSCTVRPEPVWQPRECRVHVGDERGDPLDPAPQVLGDLVEERVAEHPPLLGRERPLPFSRSRRRGSAGSPPASRASPRAGRGRRGARRGRSPARRAMSASCPRPRSSSPQRCCTWFASDTSDDRVASFSARDRAQHLERPRERPRARLRPVRRCLVVEREDEQVALLEPPEEIESRVALGTRTLERPDGGGKLAGAPLGGNCGLRPRRLEALAVGAPPLDPLLHRSHPGPHLSGRLAERRLASRVLGLEAPGLAACELLRRARARPPRPARRRAAARPPPGGPCSRRSGPRLERPRPGR